MIIRLFEKYSQYYEEISHSEYVDIFWNLKHEKFTKKEELIILSYFSSNQKDNSYIDKFETLIINNGFGITTARFNKIEDEYYIITHNRHYYKCDQYEGLMEWFRNKLYTKI